VLALALAGWLAVLLPWRSRAREVGAAEHQRGMYRALAVWALTDVVVLATFSG
jgi:hypothetical protein